MTHPAVPSLVEGTNSYVTLANAQTYFANRFSHDAWHNLDPGAQLRVLITASQQISRMVITSAKMPFTPSADQALQDATCELALAMAIDSAVVDQANTSQNIKSVKAGSVNVQFFRPTSGGRFPSLVTEILAEAGLIEGNGASAPFSSGVTETSQFDDCDIYTRNTSF